MARIERKATYEGKREALKNDAIFSMEEIEDVLVLIANRQVPDGRFSDNECELWSLMKRKLAIRF